jgi:hypothetical protein
MLWFNYVCYNLGLTSTYDDYFMLARPLKNKWHLKHVSFLQNFLMIPDFQACLCENWNNMQLIVCPIWTLNSIYTYSANLVFYIYIFIRFFLDCVGDWGPDLKSTSRISRISHEIWFVASRGVRGVSWRSWRLVAFAASRGVRGASWRSWRWRRVVAFRGVSWCSWRLAAFTAFGGTGMSSPWWYVLCRFVFCVI